MSTPLSTQADRTLVFVDAAVADYQTLANGVRSGVEVVVLDPAQDGVQQITAALHERSEISSIQIISHGEPDRLHLGSAQLSIDTLDRYRSQVQRWSASLAKAADILLYGCNVVSGGDALIQRLSQLTGATIAASNNPTGAGGDWTLAVTTGKIRAIAALRPEVMQTYQGTLGTITVTSTADSGAGSLRAAIASATSGSTIKFASSLTNKTITLTSGQLDIAAGKNLIIDGANTPGLTISGNKASRIFSLNSTAAQPTSLTVKNLILANGYTSDRGGAISTTHQGALTVENVAFNNNIADKGGGAIFSAYEGTLSVTNSQFNGNKATAGNDERGAGAIAFWGPRTFTVRDSKFVNNQGINGGAINSLNGKLTIENSQFVNNSTLAARYDTGKSNPTLRGYGGAIYTDRASATSEPSGTIRITKSVFEGNKGKAEGGAAYLYTGTQDNVIIQLSSFKNNGVQALTNGNTGNGGALVLMTNGLNKGTTISSSSFVGNTATNQGGGVWMMGSPTTITNSTFSGNAVSGTDYSKVGGAMTLYSATKILNSTIANNRAGWVGGGISADSNAAVSVKNTIFYKNTADNGTNNWGIEQHTNRELTDLGGNIQYPPKKTNNWNDYNATAKITLADPKLGPLQDNGGGLLTYALLPGSPAINAGVSSGAPTLDQRGYRRDSKVDIGAIEAGATPSVSSPASTGTAGTAGTDALLKPADASTPQLVGSPGRDVLTASSSDDLLVGGLGPDLLTGGLGADRFLYTGATKRAALANSRVNAPDHIRDFNAVQGDRLQLDYDNNLATVQRPKGLFNAGTIGGKNLVAATRSAYTDKNQKAKGKQVLKANEAVLFKWHKHAYLSVNDNVRAFNTRDLVVDVTGIQLATGRDATAGVLPVTHYFV
jgi:predicted outer membrane repeat protein